MAEQVPSVGRVVHYVAFGSPGGEYKAGAHRAAIITETYDPHVSPETTVGLMVVNPTGIHFRDAVDQDPTGQIPGTWHWPEFVPSR